VFEILQWICAATLIISLTLTLDTHGEQLVAAHLRSGLHHIPEEMVTRAIKEQHSAPTVAMRPDEAVDDISA
jgi:hypothetical protein